MRQWLVDPKLMCRKHLFGEHVEHHMFLGTLLKKKNIAGYIRNNLFEPLLLKQRHDELAQEIINRGYNHNSPLDYNISIFDYLEKEIVEYKIDRQKAEQELLARCEFCRLLYNK